MESSLLVALLLAGLIWILRRGKFGQGFTEDVRLRYQNYSYYIILAAQHNQVPIYMMERIAYIESRFDPTAEGSHNEKGMFQVTPPVLADYNNAKGTNWTSNDLFDVWISSEVAGWLLSNNLIYYNGDVEKTVRAYNTGRGNINSSAGDRYWNLFVEAGNYFPVM